MENFHELQSSSDHQKLNCVRSRESVGITLLSLTILSPSTFLISGAA